MVVWRILGSMFDKFNFYFEFKLFYKEIVILSNVFSRLIMNIMKEIIYLWCELFLIRN